MAKIADKTTTELWYAYYRDGHSLTATGKRFGTSRYVVGHAFRRFQLPLRSQAHGLYLARNVKAETMAMYELYKAGATFEQLAPRYHISPSGIQYRFATYGLPCRPNHRLRKTA